MSNMELREARIDLSIAEASKPYLRNWVGADNYEVAKKRNQARADKARKTLMDAVPPGGTIWYYEDLPTMGNKFRTGNICAITGLPWSVAREMSYQDRLIKAGEHYQRQTNDRPVNKTPP